MESTRATPTTLVPEAEIEGQSEHHRAQDVAQSLLVDGERWPQEHLSTVEVLVPPVPFPSVCFPRRGTEGVLTYDCRSVPRKRLQSIDAAPSTPLGSPSSFCVITPSAAPLSVAP